MRSPGCEGIDAQITHPQAQHQQQQPTNQKRHRVQLVISTIRGKVTNLWGEIFIDNRITHAQHIRTPVTCTNYQPPASGATRPLHQTTTQLQSKTPWCVTGSSWSLLCAWGCNGRANSRRLPLAFLAGLTLLHVIECPCHLLLHVALLGLVVKPLLKPCFGRVLKTHRASRMRTMRVRVRDAKSCEINKM